MHHTYCPSCFSHRTFCRCGTLFVDLTQDPHGPYVRIDPQGGFDALPYDPKLPADPREEGNDQ